MLATWAFMVWRGCQRATKAMNRQRLIEEEEHDEGEEFVGYYYSVGPAMR